MKRNFAFVAVALFLASTVSAGAGCYEGHDQQVMTCAEGSVWDTQSQSCVPQTTS